MDDITINILYNEKKLIGKIHIERYFNARER